MNRLYLLCILITFILSSLHAATPKVLSLNKFVKYSLKNHPIVKMNHSNYMASVLKSEATDSIYESNLFLNTYYTKGSLNSFTNSFNDDNSSLNSSVGLSKTFPKYGTQLTASASYVKQLNNGSIPTGATPINFPDVYTGALTLTLRQSLYKNVTGIHTMYPLKVAEIERKLAKTIYINDMQDFVSVLTSNYLTWRHHFICVQILKKQLLNTEKQVQLMKKQYQRGTTELREYLQAKQHSQQQQLILLLEEEHLTKIEQNLSTLYYGRFTKKSFNFYPEEAPFYFKQPLTKNGVRSHHSLELINLSKALTTLTKEKATDAKRQQIDLVASINQLGAGQSNDSITDTITDNRIYSLGLEVLFPFLSEKAKKDYQSAQSAEEGLQFHYKNVSAELKSNQDMLYKTISTLSQLINESRKLLDISKSVVKEESKAYKQGRLPSYSLVIQSQNNVLSAKLQEETIKHQLLLTKHMISILESDYTRFYKLKELK